MTGVAQTADLALLLTSSLACASLITRFLGLGQKDKAQYYVGIVPSIIFSLVSIFIGFQVKRYVRRPPLTTGLGLDSG